MERLRVAAARYRLGRETAESLRTLGVELLAEGRTEAVELATVQNAHSASISEVGPIFERLCTALEQPIPSLDDAIDIVTAAILRDIADGPVTPELGLQRLMDDVYDPHVSTETDVEYVGESRGLQHLIGTYWSYPELRERPKELSIDGRFGEAAIPLLDQRARQQANDWLSTHASGEPS